MGSEELSLFMSAMCSQSKCRKPSMNMSWFDLYFKGWARLRSVDLEEFQIEDGGKKDRMEVD